MEKFVKNLLKKFANVGAKNLSAGFPISYYDNKYPDYVVREYPDGRKELVGVNLENGTFFKVFPVQTRNKSA